MDDGPPVAVAVATPLTLGGPWTVAFPPDRGAPPAVTLSELRSLSDSADSGVKYFSGAATYHHSLDVPADWLGPNRRVVLDLGRVEVIAQVRVNGRDVGLLWKAPYRVDVTAAVHAGVNDLEVRATDLWVNRLIGDEQLPPENQYEHDGAHGILQLPSWYRDGAQKPRGGRVTFLAWQFYTKDEPLLASGLLGPVRLFSAVQRVLEWPSRGAAGPNG